MRTTSWPTHVARAHSMKAAPGQQRRTGPSPGGDAGGRQQLRRVGLRRAEPLPQGRPRLGRDLPQVLGPVVEEVGPLLRRQGGQVRRHLLEVPLGFDGGRVARGSEVRGGGHAVRPTGWTS